MHKPHNFIVWVLFGPEYKPLEAYLKFPKLLVRAKLLPRLESLSWDFSIVLSPGWTSSSHCHQCITKIYQYNMGALPKANWCTDCSPGEQNTAHNWATRLQKERLMLFKISAPRSLLEKEIFYSKKPPDVQICHHSAMAGRGRFSFAVVLRAHFRPAVSHSAVQNPPLLPLYSQRTSAPPSYWNFFLVLSPEI